MAAWFLAQRGGVVVARNLSVGRGEIDLVVRWGAQHAAVEVKTIGPGAIADDPIERLSQAKLEQVRSLAGRLGRKYGRMRVDFVGVCATDEGVSVNWRMNAG